MHTSTNDVLIAIILTLAKLFTQLQFLVDQPHHETSALSLFQSFQPVSPNIDANMSPPSISSDQPMPYIQTIQKRNNTERFTIEQPMVHKVVKVWWLIILTDSGQTNPLDFPARLIKSINEKKEK